MATPDAFVPIAITDRNGFDESVHFGAAVILGPTGDVEYAAGDPRVVVYPRSSNKPAQAVAMVRHGLDLPDELLALVCASHDGAPVHLAGARRILATVGLDESALRNTPDLPLDDTHAQTVLRDGGGPTRLQMNCSGKHSGMLATCCINEWGLDDYLDQQHPLQLAITETLDELAGETPAHIGIDGCGAPAHAISLIGLARSLRSIATGDAGASGARVAAAMAAHPHMVGGERRDVTQLMRRVPGAVAKDGADGVFVVALHDGRSIALKVADGSDRARPPVMLALLDRAGVDVTAVAASLVSPIIGHGQPVGAVRAVLP
jgi:L-asparaginase II